MFGQLSTPRGRTILGILAIALATIMVAIYAPQQKPTTILGPDDVPETVVVTHAVSSVDIGHELDYAGVHLTIKSAQIAEKFSDDKNRQGKYTLRVEVDALNKGKEVIGVQYADNVYLQLPNGDKVRTKRMSVKPEAVPGQLQSGFFDYPLATPIDLASLKLVFSDGTVVPFH